MKRKQIWALVANGATARIIKDIRAGQAPETIEFLRDHPRMGEIMTDRAGRSFSSADTRRSAMEPHSDPVQEHQRLFAGELSTALEQHCAAGEFDELIVIAAPGMLGDLRQSYPKKLRASITHEVDKDLTNLTAAKLIKAITDIADDRR